jgi:BioD-like phosphotransacetylase family protein
MADLLLLSPEARSGKTAIAAGLAERLRVSNHALALKRLPGDVNADTDGALFATLARASPDSAGAKKGSRLIEAPAGDPRPFLDEQRGTRAIVVAGGSKQVAAVLDYCQAVGDRLVGVVLNKVPTRRTEAIRADARNAGINVVAVLPEDRVLAAPILGDVALALSAKLEHFSNGTALRPLDRPVIATISADPGQAHFARYDASAVIVRSDKPDLQLAAINAGATCLIVTGGLPILSYVLDRAAEDEIPLLRTSLDTTATVKAIEEMFAAAPFPGGDAKLQRIVALLSDVDVKQLTGSAA